MGRVKVDIKKIQDSIGRRVTFSKRSNGLIKKAYELCVLSDIDLALTMFSPSGRLVTFSGRKRSEDVLIHYLNLPEQEILSGLATPIRDGGEVLANREALIGTLNRIKHEDKLVFSQANESAMKTIEEITKEMTGEPTMLDGQLETVDGKLSMFEPDPLHMNSLEALNSFEQDILKMLACIKKRKDYLLNSQASSSSYYPYLQEQKSPIENCVVSWFPNGDPKPSAVVKEYDAPISESDIPTTGYYTTLLGTSTNMDLPTLMDHQFVYDSDNEILSTKWQHSYASPYPSPSNMEYIYDTYPLLQHEEDDQSMGGMPQVQTGILISKSGF